MSREPPVRSDTFVRFLVLPTVGSVSKEPRVALRRYQALLAQSDTRYIARVVANVVRRGIVKVLLVLNSAPDPARGGGEGLPGARGLGGQPGHVRVDP